jgi:succinyl-CoA synthetase alpha subunit
MEEAFEKHPDVTVCVNFASFRSVYSSVMETLKFSDQIKTIAIIAEGVPESQTRALNKEAHKKNVGIIGPATVGGIKVSKRNHHSVAQIKRVSTVILIINRFSFQILSPGAFESETLAACSTIL